MVKPSAEGPERTVLAWARAWLDLLAAGRLDEACTLLDEPNSYGVRWTPRSVAAVVADTFAVGTRFRDAHPEGPVFTPVATASGHANASVGAFDDGSGYWVEHDVPLNGAYHDLTAQFEFRWRGDDGALAAILHDLHVP